MRIDPWCISGRRLTPISFCIFFCSVPIQAQQTTQTLTWLLLSCFFFVFSFPLVLDRSDGTNFDNNPVYCYYFTFRVKDNRRTIGMARERERGKKQANCLFGFISHFIGLDIEDVLQHIICIQIRTIAFPQCHWWCALVCLHCSPSPSPSLPLSLTPAHSHRSLCLAAVQCIAHTAPKFRSIISIRISFTMIPDSVHSRFESATNKSIYFHTTITTTTTIAEE